MAEESRVGSPLELTARTIRSAWNTLLMVYYANSVSWRIFKSGGLFFFGFFLWSAANLLYSYVPSWSFLTYVMAYGLVVIIYGPFHHLIVIPLALRFRRSGRDAQRWIGGHLPNSSLVVFLVIVLVLGTFPVYPVQIDLGSELGSAAPDINPSLACVKATSGDGTAVVHCHLTRSEGIDRVVVESGGQTVLVDEDPPFEFTLHEDDLESVVGQKQFQVVLLDENGDTIRRYTRSLAVIPER